MVLACSASSKITKNYLNITRITQQHRKFPKRTRKLKEKYKFQMKTKLQPREIHSYCIYLFISTWYIMLIF